MAITKLLVITAVLALGTSGVFYAIQNYHLLNPETAGVVSQNENNNLVSSQPLVENLSEAINPESVSDNDNSLNTIFNEKNLAGEISKNLAEVLVANNPNGPVTNADGQPEINVPDPASLASALFTETAQKIGLDEINFTINDSELNILSGGSRQDLDNYLANLKNIFETVARNQSKVPADENLAGILIAAHQKVIEQLYQLATPQPAMDFHKNLLSALLTKKKALETIQLYSDDAVAIILTSRVINQANQNLADAFQELNQLLQ